MMSDSKTLTINDVEFQVGPCRHCGGTASEVEALKALADWGDWIGERPLCAVCGASIRMVKVILDHKLVGQSPGTTAWKVKFVVYSDCANFTGFGGTQVRVHGECARTAMPHADWPSMDGTSYTEEGRRPRPWDALANRERPHGD